MSGYKNLIYFSLLSIITTVSCVPADRLTSGVVASETVINKDFGNQGTALSIHLNRGKHHNHPTFAVWIEDMEGKVIQTLFVTQSFATGYYRYGSAGDGKWLKVPGEAIRPAALPYWVNRAELNKGKIPDKESPVADAYTGATPEASVRLDVQTIEMLPISFRVLLEVNQPWDWNAYWNNDKYLDEPDYKTSAQPSVVYAVTINLESMQDKFFLNPIGHGHYSGKDGILYTDLSNLTTALEIFTRSYVVISRSNNK